MKNPLRKHKTELLVMLGCALGITALFVIAPMVEKKIERAADTEEQRVVLQTTVPINEPAESIQPEYETESLTAADNNLVQETVVEQESAEQSDEPGDDPDDEQNDEQGDEQNDEQGDEHELVDDAGEGEAEMWVDGKRVPMSAEEIAAFEERMYACKTKAEYEELMKNLASYNKGIDMSRFAWYWDDLRDLYSDEQIEIMQGQSGQKSVPNIVGMTWQQAYRTMTDAGFIIRMYYHYDADCDLPVHYCMWQEVPPGTMYYSNANFFVHLQGPEALGNYSVFRHPDDEDFDLADEIAGLRMIK